MRSPAIIDAVVSGRGLSSEERTLAEEREHPEFHGPVLGDMPRTVSRFLILGELGRGGMGRVYRAYDPSLTREVAIKLLRPGLRNDKARARLLREAQAMAQLSHPNIVGIYEVGEHEAQVFLAMELVVGETLREWCKVERSHREILAVFRQAAAGLAAAHALGIIHRDFKPSNVFVGHDGSAHVGDFGLAKSGGPLGEISSEGDEASNDSDELTAVGSVVGTPAYMAPEQHHRHPVTAASDQYGFGVALYEAFEGRRPFKARELAELVDLKDRGAVLAFDRTPRKVARLIQRMLAVDPKARFAQMDDVVAALTPRRLGATWGALGGAVVAGVLVATATAVTSDEPTCHAPRLDSWTADDRAAIGASFIETGGPFAQQTFEGAAMRIDAQVEGWQRQHVETCRTAVTLGSQVVASARYACLDEARAELEAMIEVMAQASPAVIGRAPEVADELSPIERCSDPDLVRARYGPARPAEKIGGLRRSLARYSVLAGARVLQPEDVAEVEDLAERAAQLDPALGAKAGRVLGESLFAAGRREEGVHVLEGAYFEAVAESLWGDAARNAALIARAGVGHPLSFEQRLEWADHAEALSHHVEGRDRILVDLEITRAYSHSEWGLSNPELAAAHGLRAVELARGSDVSERHRINALLFAGNALVKLGRLEAGRNLVYASLARNEARFGSVHLRVADDLRYVLRAEMARGDLEAAKQAATREHDIRAQLEGPKARRTLQARSGLAVVQIALGELDAAAEGLEFVARHRPPDAHSVNRAFMYLNLGDVQARQGSFAEALVSLERGRSQLVEAGTPPTSGLFAEVESRVGLCHLWSGDGEEALPHLEAALRDPTAFSHWRRVELYLALGSALVETGGPAIDVAAALEQADRSANMVAVLPGPIEARRNEMGPALVAYLEDSPPP